MNPCTLNEQWQPEVKISLCWTLLIIISIMSISGCATMGKNECLNARWQSIGYEDGAAGHAGSRIGEHRRACAEYNVVPDLDKYNLGRSQGLREWCTSGNGYYQGSRGTAYKGVCPEVLQEDFLEAYNIGLEVYAYRKEMQELEEDIADMQYQLDALEGEIILMEEEMVSDNVQPRRRRKLLNLIRSAEKDREMLLFDISDSGNLLLNMKEHLRSMSAKHSQ